MAKSQKDAVVNAVIAILGSNFTPGSVAKKILTEDQRNSVRSTIYDGIIAGEIKCDKDTSDTKELKKYVNGMIDNHLRRAKALNGGITYKPSKEGTKRDPQLKELNKLLSACEFPEGSTERQDIISHIERRKTELASEKQAKRVASNNEVDVSKLPPHLQGLVANVTTTEDTTNEA